jgi:hypothetical protein
MSRRASVAGLVTSFVTAIACGGCGSERAPIPPASPSPVPVVISLQVSGNTSLTAIGETSQLTATASYSDGTTRDASSQVRWTSVNDVVVSVSPGGLLTATGFGSTRVNAFIPDTGTLRSVSVTVLATGTFIVGGRVREPGVGPLRGVRVSEAVSGLSMLTDTGGGYLLIGVKSLRLSFDTSGFESRTFEVAEDDDVPMQPLVRFPIGGNGTTTIAPNDLTYTVGPGVQCGPCRLVRIATTPGTRFEVRATWARADARVMLWIDGRRFERAGSQLETVADATGTGQEVLVYVEVNRLPNGTHVPITVTASPR